MSGWQLSHNLWAAVHGGEDDGDGVRKREGDELRAGELQQGQFGGRGDRSETTEAARTAPANPGDQMVVVKILYPFYRIGPLRSSKHNASCHR